MYRLIRRALLPCLFIAGLSLPSAQAAMTTPGQFGVSPSGAATYTIPIQVPPGTAGIEPKLALSYNSQGGNGLLGMGWSLSGLSAIGRCPRTMAQDNVRGAVNYDNNDRYCLDGQRLIAVHGIDGGDGTEYRTELDSFAKIISYGSAGSTCTGSAWSMVCVSAGPAWFKVWTKSGQVMEYGNTDDSRIEAQGTSTVRVWALNRLQDTKGNYLTVSYIENNPAWPSGEDYHPARIDFGGNAVTAASPNGSMLFTYGGRPDLAAYSHGGVTVKNTIRLSGIASYISNVLVQEIRLTYDLGPSIGRSRLRSLTTCGNDGTCFPPTTFNWNEANYGLVDYGAISSNYAAWASSPDRIHPMDIDGDGRSDLLLGPDSSGNWYLMQGGVNGFVDRGRIASGAYGAWATDSTAIARIRVMDIDGDGKQDIVLGPDSGGNWYWLQSTGSSLIDRGLLATNAYGAWATDSTAIARIRVMDINGDGEQDIVFGPDGNGNWYWLQSTGSALIDRGLLITNAYGGWGADSTTIPRIRVMDLDGDRKQDIVLGPNSNGEWFELQSTGSGFVDKGLLISGAYGAFATTNEGIACIRVMDVSGDGLQDIVLGPDGNGNWYVLVSTGKSLADSGAWITGAYANWRSLPSQIRAMDINGDGRQDILIGPYDNGQWFALKAEADHFTNLGSILNSSYGAWSSSADRIRLMDLDGEGMADIVLGPYDNGQWFTIHSNGIQGKINEMANGTGATTAITYKPLTDSSVYTKDSGSNGSSYPRLDLQMPLYVVSSATSSNGIGGVVTTNYRYGGLKAELGTGRGLLGFRWIDATQAETGLVTHTEYRQDFPYTGLPSLVKKTLSGAGNGGLLSQSSTDYGCLNPADGSACVIGVGKRYFPYASQGTEASWDLNGAALPTISTASDYDLWGNPLHITIGSSDGYSKTTTNRYTNDESNWLLGRLTNATVTSTTP